MPLPYILFKAVPSRVRPGKTDKIPIDHRTLAVASAHDPAIHTDRVTAERAAARAGAPYGIAVVINPPYWFIDLDEVWTGKAWSPATTDLCAALAGAYVEVSLSGRGIHIIGRGAVPPHSIKNPSHQADLYSQLRFCALTGTHARGDMECDLTAAIGQVAARYFPPAAVDRSPAEWTECPCEGWSGPVDDDELIRRASASRSAAASFGGRASFAHLWAADATALAATYPPDGNGAMPYDGNVADLALAQHLAFWTGKNCARMERLMLRSALLRGKWEDRPEYLRNTIVLACSRQRDVASGRAVTAPVGTTKVRQQGGLRLAGDLAGHFAGAVYIEDRYQAAAPDGAMLKPTQFNTSHRYGGARFMLDEGKSTRVAWDAFTANEAFLPPFAHSICFRPELPSRALIPSDGRVLFNNYVPVNTRAVAGDPSRFMDLLRRLIPNERDLSYLLAWMARVVQSPGCKLQWAPLLQGVQGNGKTVVVEALIQAVGERYSHVPNARDLGNVFNAWLDQKLLIGIEEIHIKERRDLLESLKPMITNRRIEFQGKGLDQITGDNRANFILCTNHRDAIPKTEDDRRYAIFFTAQQIKSDLTRDGMDGGYFPSLYAWLRADGFATVTHMLRNHAIPAELDPAGAMHRAPETSSTKEAIRASLGPVEQAVQEAIDSEEIGFRGGWVSSFYLSLMLEMKKLRLVPTQWDETMRVLGYHKPGPLPSGRLTMTVPPEGRKSRLWVKMGSVADLNLSTPSQVCHAYSAANSAASRAA